MSIWKFKLVILVEILGIIFVQPSFGIDNAVRQNDSELMSNVTKKLYRDKFFDPETLEVKVKDSVVTLTGNTASLRTRDRAIGLAESISGVKGVVDELQVKGPVRTDEQITHDTARALSLDDATRNFKIHVQSASGIVTLNGRVDSRAEKDLASWVAKGTRGVRGVDNEIQLTSNEIRPDNEIQADVREELRLDPYLNDDALTVEVKNGRVFIKGKIDNLNQERRIYEESLVRGTTGIDLIGVEVAPGENTLSNKSNQTYSDLTVKNALDLTFHRDPRLKNSIPKVRVYEHVATLSGSVNNLKAKSTAEEDAKNTLGVAEVLNNIKVKPSTLRKDKDIAADVQEALGLDPLLDASNIYDQVSKGVVTLKGKASGYYESWIAGEDASQIGGVREIKNQIVASPIAPTEPKSDFLIQSDLILRLKEDPALNFGDNIKVNVSNGRAVLTGEVGSRLQVDIATKDALDSGAGTVANDLRIPGQKSLKTRVYSSMPLEFYSFTDKVLQPSSEIPKLTATSQTLMSKNAKLKHKKSK